MRRLIACAGGSAILVLSLAGCIMEGSRRAEPADLEIVNQSDVELSIVIDYEISSGIETSRSVDPHDRTALALAGSGEDCIDWTVLALVDGVEVSSVGPPVCGGDQWVITQDDVKDAS